MRVPEVLASAKAFFAHRSGIYAAFLEKQGPTWISLRGQGGEEIVVAAHDEAGSTSVTASSYMFDAQVAQFLSSLPPPNFEISFCSIVQPCCIRKSGRCNNPSTTP